MIGVNDTGMDAAGQAAGQLESGRAQKPDGTGAHPGFTDHARKLSQKTDEFADKDSQRLKIIKDLVSKIKNSDQKGAKDAHGLNLKDLLKGEGNTGKLKDLFNTGGGKNPNMAIPPQAPPASGGTAAQPGAGQPQPQQPPGQPQPGAAQTSQPPFNPNSTIIPKSLLEQIIKQAHPYGGAHHHRTGEPGNIKGNPNSKISPSNVDTTPYQGGGTPDEWADYGLKANGIQPGTPTYQIAHQVVKEMMFRESSNNPNSINNTVPGSNKPMGILNMKLETYAESHVAGTSNQIFDPYSNAAADVHYEMKRYGLDTPEAWTSYGNARRVNEDH